MLIRTFILKVINNDRKFSTDHEIIESVITQVCKESKFWIHPNLRILDSFELTVAKFFIYLFI